MSDEGMVLDVTPKTLQLSQHLRQWGVLESFSTPIPQENF
jgi:hypothetical protein